MEATAPVNASERLLEVRTVDVVTGRGRSITLSSVRCPVRARSAAVEECAHCAGERRDRARTRSRAASTSGAASPFHRLRPAPGRPSGRSSARSCGATAVALRPGARPRRGRGRAPRARGRGGAGGGRRGAARRDRRRGRPAARADRREGLGRDGAGRAGGARDRDARPRRVAHGRPRRRAARRSCPATASSSACSPRSDVVAWLAGHGRSARGRRRARGAPGVAQLAARAAPLTPR